MKYFINLSIALLLPVIAFTQTITHEVNEYSFKKVGDGEVKQKVYHKVKLFYSGFCENSGARQPIIVDIYSSDNVVETLLLGVYKRETDKENNRTIFYADLVGTEITSPFYSGDEPIIIVLQSDSIALGFEKIELFLRNYTTKVEY
ncbi:MAG: hypothetical protein IPN08_17995 [Bacteroidales bacterium]|nr:hypothetical protein [Bacteroidales bacterium]